MRAVHLSSPSAACTLHRHLNMADLGRLHLLHGMGVARDPWRNHDLGLGARCVLLLAVCLGHWRILLLAGGSRARVLWEHLLRLRLGIALGRHLHLQRLVLLRWIALLLIAIWLLRW